MATNPKTSHLIQTNSSQDTPVIPFLEIHPSVIEQRAGLQDFMTTYLSRPPLTPQERQVLMELAEIFKRPKAIITLEKCNKLRKLLGLQSLTGIIDSQTTLLDLNWWIYKGFEGTANSHWMVTFLILTIQIKRLYEDQKQEEVNAAHTILQLNTAASTSTMTSTTLTTSPLNPLPGLQSSSPPPIAMEKKQQDSVQQNKKKRKRIENTTTKFQPSVKVGDFAIFTELPMRSSTVLYEVIGILKKDKNLSVHVKKKNTEILDYWVFRKYRKARKDGKNGIWTKSTHKIKDAEQRYLIEFVADIQ